MFIKCNCVGRLAGNEKSHPCVFKDLHKHKDGGGKTKSAGYSVFRAYRRITDSQGNTSFLKGKRKAGHSIKSNWLVHLFLLHRQILRCDFIIAVQLTGPDW